MKKTMKILSIILIALMLTAFMGTMSLAADESSVVNNLFSDNDRDPNSTSGIIGVGNNIVNIITTVGIIVAVIVLLILGIKYMMGSASEKAEYKKTMIPYLVGAVLIFGASAIAKAVIAMTGSITAG